jgi:cytoskeleton protein RodZ
MTDIDHGPIQPELPLPIGDRLRQARENAGLSTQEVADQTRIPRRHIEAIEGNRLTALPSGPYAIGFARAIARIVGYPEEEAANAIRMDLGRNDGGGHYVSHMDQFEPADGARIPPKTLAWTAAIIGVLLIGGYSIWRTTGDSIAPSESQAAASTATAAGGDAPTTPAGAAPAAGTLDGPLTLRASGEVWFGLNDPATGRLVFYRTLAAGESYVVPADQRNLRLRTSRAQDLRLVVGSRELPQLGAPDTLVKDIALDPASLAARASAAPPMAEAASATAAPQR